jgi:hypothetical protein
MAKTKVVLVQNAGGTVDRVRIGDTDIPVTHAGPAVVNGTMGVTLMIENADVSVATDTPEASGATPRAKASSKG